MIQLNSKSPDRWVLAGFEAGGIGTRNLVRVSDEKVCDEKDGKSYFVKTTTSQAQARRFQGEAESLKALARANPRLVAQLICEGEYMGKRVMVSERFEVGYLTLEAEARLGREVASMHDWTENEGARSPTGMYGFHVPTYCGQTQQDNTWEEDWMKFYRDRRLKALIDKIDDPEILRLGNKICDQVAPILLCNFLPKPEPVIIHGDMWSGNVHEDKATGKPVIYDPSSYYGHHEVELGIMKMFGGRSDIFFDQYHSRLPKSEPHHEQRIQIYELYHHLNHTLIFGSGYRRGAIKIMHDLIQFIAENTHE